MLTSNMLILFAAAVSLCLESKLPCRITSMNCDQTNVVHTSMTHSGRAVDMSVEGWTRDDIKTFCSAINKKYKGIAAISMSDYKPRAALYEPNDFRNQGPHIHLQVKKQ